MLWHKTPVVVKSDGGECLQGWGSNAPALRLGLTGFLPNDI